MGSGRPEQFWFKLYTYPNPMRKRVLLLLLHTW